MRFDAPAGFPLDGTDDLIHRLASLIDQRCALLKLLDIAGDECLDLFGSFGTALSKVAHLTGHHREALPRVRAVALR